MHTYDLFSSFKAISSIGVVYVAWRLFRWAVIQPLRSPLRNLPGPPFQSLLDSHIGMVMTSPEAHDKFVKTHGKSVRIKGFGYIDDRLLTLDPRAMSHVLNNPLIYEKPWQSRRLISSLIGNGLLASEGVHHKKQRKVMNPAFSHQNMKAYTPLMMSKAHELRRRWLDLSTGPHAAPSLDMVHWLSRATFDVIGLAGFDYTFNAIQQENNDVYLAYKEMFDSSINKQGTAFRGMVSIFFPWFDRIWPSEAVKIVRKSHGIIYGVGNQIIQDKKQEFLQGKADGKNDKSMLSLLIKSNLSETNVSQQITDRDIMDQINTFFFAGSDTTSLALAWTFLLLSQYPNLQTQLREEILAAAAHTNPDDEDSLDIDFSVIDSLPFLDKVTKESLRLIPPVHSSLRVALQDDVIPTDFPVKLNDGRETHSIPIQKGQFVHVAIEGFNLDKTVWGEDAWEFKPDRWDDLPKAVRSQPGLWQNMMTFSAGPRSCIGMRFSIIEMKTFLYVLIPAFTFDIVPDMRFFKMNVVLTRPYVRGEFGAGSQLPLVVKPYQPRK